MDYERAIAEAKMGRKLMRPHWCWVYMSLSVKHDGKLALFEDEGTERGVFRPTRSDRKADDWMIDGLGAAGK